MLGSYSPASPLLPLESACLPTMLLAINGSSPSHGYNGWDTHHVVGESTGDIAGVVRSVLHPVCGPPVSAGI